MHNTYIYCTQEGESCMIEMRHSDINIYTYIDVSLQMYTNQRVKLPLGQFHL